MNKCISKKPFSSKLETAKIAPIFKKNDPNGRTNSRPISLFPLIICIFKNILNKRFEKFSEKILLPKLGFRKGYSVQSGFLKLLKIWRKGLDK